MGKISKWKRRIKAKRGNKCEMCGVPEGSKPQEFLHCHHVLKVRTHPQAIMAVSNIMVLCPACHQKAEITSV